MALSNIPTTATESLMRKMYDNILQVPATVKTPVDPQYQRKSAPPMNMNRTLGRAEAGRLLHGRLRVPEGMMVPLDFIDFHLTDTEAFVFVVTKGKPVTIEDDPNLFPSDTLITQLRLLIEAQNVTPQGNP